MMLRRVARRFERRIPGIARRDAIALARIYIDSQVIANNGRT